MMTKENIEAECFEINAMAEVARSAVEPDSKGFHPGKSITGEFKKHYKYDPYDEVYVDLFQNGALLYKAGSVYEWYGKEKVSKCFEKAKILGARSKRLNRMF